MAELMIRITGEDADVHAEDVDEASRALRQELTEIDEVVVGEVQAGPPPPGTRGAINDVVGMISLSIVTGGMYVRTAPDLKKLVASLAKVLHGWQDRNKGKKVLIELPDGTKVDLTDYSESSAERIIEALKAGRSQQPAR